MLAVSDDYGHADVGTALIICLPTAISLMQGWGRFSKEDEMVMVDDKELTEEEVKEMPDELRELYEMDSKTDRYWDDDDTFQDDDW